MTGPNPIDVTDVVDRKIAALDGSRQPAHRTRSAPQPWFEWMTNVAKQLGLPDGAAAETFRVVDTR